MSEREQKLERLLLTVSAELRHMRLTHQLGQHTLRKVDSLVTSIERATTPMPEITVQRRAGRHHMKVIFLDVDGVLNAMPRTWAEKHTPKLQPEFVMLLKGLVERTGARICVSSTWRLGDGYDTLVALLSARWNFKRAWFVGRTPSLRLENVAGPRPVAQQTRGEEIKAWLQDAAQLGHADIESFVILDDDRDMGDLLPRLVKTEQAVGLTDAHVERAAALLDVALQKCRECEGRGEYLDAPGHVLDGHAYYQRCEQCKGSGFTGL